MSGPVGVVAGVDGKVVADAIAPPIAVLRFLNATVIVVVVEVDVGFVDFKEQPVIKVGMPLCRTKICIDMRLDVEGLAIELAVVVNIGIVLACKVVADPVFVVKFYIAQNAVIQEIEFRGYGACHLFARGPVKG